MKKNKLLIPIATITSLGAIAPAIALASCGSKTPQVTYIVEPTAEQKTATPEKNVKTFEYSVTLKDETEAQASDFSVEAVNVNSTVAVSASIKSLLDKELTILVTLGGLEGFGKNTVNFGLKITNTKDVWEQTVAGYKFNFTPNALESVTLEYPTEVEYLSTGTVKVKSCQPVEAKLDLSGVTFESSDSSLISVDSKTGVVKANKGSRSADITVKGIKDNQGTTLTTDPKCTITAKNTLDTLIITYPKGHNFDVTDTEGRQPTIVDGQGRDQSVNAVWQVNEGTEWVEIDPSTGLLTLKELGKTQGGHVEVQAKVGETIKTYEFEIGSFSKLNLEKAKDGYVYPKDKNVEGVFVMPNKYYYDGDKAYELKTINNRGFFECTKLTKVHFSKSIINPNQEMFYGCTSLETITVDSSNEYLEVKDNCLCGIKGTYNGYLLAATPTSTIPTTDVTKIARSAFYKVQLQTTALTIPTNITEICDLAFKESNIQTLTFGTINSTPVEFSVDVAIGQYAFENCTSLSSVAVGPVTKLKEIGNSAFAGDTALASFTYTSGNDAFGSIGSLAFQNCRLLTEFANTESNGITEIKNDAFSGCSQLAAIRIPTTCQQIGARALSGTSDNLVIQFDDAANQLWSTYDDNDTYLWTPSAEANNTVNAKVLKDQALCQGERINQSGLYLIEDITNGSGKIISPTETFVSKGITEFNIFDKYIYASSSSEYAKEDIVLIKPNGFQKNENLLTINLSGSKLVSIGERAFSECKNVSTIKIGSGIKNVGSNAFDLTGASDVTVYIDSEEIAHWLTESGDCEGLFDTYTQVIYINSDITTDPEAGTHYIADHYTKQDVSSVSGYTEWWRKE